MNAIQGVMWAAAAYNIVIGLGGMVQSGATREARIVGLLVLGFGVAYGLVAFDLERYLPVLWAGVIGKLGVIAILAPAVARGEQPRALGWVLAGDGLFAGFFLFLLLHTW